MFRPAAAIPVTVTALRLDDFDGPIEVTIEDLPPGSRHQGAINARAGETTAAAERGSAAQNSTGAVPLEYWPGHIRQPAY